jgi:hypothetical protein
LREQIRMVNLRELTQYLSQGLGTDFSRSAGAARQSGQTYTHLSLFLFLVFSNSSINVRQFPGDPLIFNPAGIFITVK